MRNKLISKILLSIIFLLVFQITTANTPPLSTAYAGEVKRINIGGEATVDVIPDIAVISLGVQRKGKNLTTIQTEVALVLDKIIQMLKTESISENDIQTSNYSIYPEYSYEKNTSCFTGYNVSCSLTVKIWDIKKTGQIMQKALQEGSNTNNGVSYEISDEKTYYKKALKLAVLDAKSKAVILAENLGIESYEVFSITEKQTGYTFIKRMAYSDFSASEISVMPGKITVSACVEVSFSF